MPLAESCSNFKAETSALQNAVAYIAEMKPQKTVILTDSKAALQSPVSNTPDQPNPQLLKDLQLLLHGSKPTVGFQEMKKQIAWLSLGANNCKPCPALLTRKPKPCSETAKNVNGKEPLETTSLLLTPVNRLARHEQTTIFRLRTEHYGLRAHLKRAGIIDSALCDCKGAEQTVHHILQDCPI